FTEGLADSGGGEDGKRAGAAQAWMGKERLLGLERGNEAIGQRTGVSGRAQLADRKGGAAREGGAKIFHAPTRWGNAADAVDEDAFHAAFLKMRVALAPPKPKELVRAQSTRALADWVTRGKRQTGSGVWRPGMGGSHWPSRAMRQMA